MRRIVLVLVVAGIIVLGGVVAIEHGRRGIVVRHSPEPMGPLVALATDYWSFRRADDVGWYTAVPVTFRNKSEAPIVVEDLTVLHRRNLRLMVCG